MQKKPLPAKKYLLLVILVFILHNTVFADDFHVFVCGTIKFRDADAVTDRPLAFAMVEVWDSDVLGSSLTDDLMGFTMTDKDGNYCVDAIGGDPGHYGWSRPDVYIKVLMVSDDGVLRLTDELNFTQSYDSDHHSHDDVEGNLSMGTLILGTDISSVNQGTKVIVFHRARAAMLDFVTHLGPIPSGFYDVEYFAGWVTGSPWTNVNTTHWPRNHSIEDHVISHEFAHTVRHSLDGDMNELLGDNAKYVYLREHDCDTYSNLGFAFNEGWSEFWSSQVTAGSRTTVNFENECDVAALLHRIAALLPNHRFDMVRVLRENPGKIHSYQEFCTKANLIFPGSCPFVGTSRHSLTIPLTVNNEAIKQQINIERKIIDAQKTYSRNLEMNYNAVKELSVSVKALKNDSLLYNYLVNLTRKHVLQAELKINELEIRRLHRSIANMQVKYSKNSGNVFFKNYEADKREYKKQVLNIIAAALSNVYKDIEKNAPKKDITKYYLSELQNQIKATAKIINDKSKIIPSNYNPYIAYDKIQY